jgi:hypothetical protein
MKLAKSILVASALALAAGSAYAADDDKDHKGFNDMDKNADGKLTRAEAKGNKDLLAKWKQADRNNDGSLSRAEYLTVMAKKDANTVKEKVTSAGKEGKEEVKEAKRRAPKADASTGATTKDSGAPK